jgi:hypothetical protein
MKFVLCDRLNTYLSSYPPCSKTWKFNIANTKAYIEKHTELKKAHCIDLYRTLTYLLTYLLTYFTYLLTHSLTPRCRILFEKLIVTRLIKKYPAFFMEPEGSSPRSEKPATGPYPEPAASSSPHISLRPSLMLSSHLRPVFPVVYSTLRRNTDEMTGTGKMLQNMSHDGGERRMTYLIHQVVVFWVITQCSDTVGCHLHFHPEDGGCRIFIDVKTSSLTPFHQKCNFTVLDGLNPFPISRLLTAGKRSRTSVLFPPGHLSPLELFDLGFPPVPTHNFPFRWSGVQIHQENP